VLAAALVFAALSTVAFILAPTFPAVLAFSLLLAVLSMVSFAIIRHAV
jgi:hypothetical protein